MPRELTIEEVKEAIFQSSEVEIVDKIKLLCAKKEELPGVTRKIAESWARKILEENSNDK